MTDWASLEHAYGAANDIPGLLAAAAADPNDRQAWDALWGRLCHQGTIYSASCPALPALTSMAARRPPAGYVEPLHLAAAIVASNDYEPEDFDAIRRDYSTELQSLRDLAEQNLRPAEGFTEFVWGLQALMAFEGSPPWGQELQALAAEELTLECPACDEYLTIAMAELPATTAAMDDALPVTAVAPADLRQLRGPTARIYALALQHGQTTVVDRLPYLFGITTCPNCGVSINLPQAVTR